MYIDGGSTCRHPPGTPGEGISWGPNWDSYWSPNSYHNILIVPLWIPAALIGLPAFWAALLARSIRVFRRSSEPASGATGVGSFTPLDDPTSDASAIRLFQKCSVVALALLLLVLGCFCLVPVLAFAANNYFGIPMQFDSASCLGLAGLGAATYSAAGVRRFSRAFRRYGADFFGSCAQCGYSLRGNLSGVCPECGRQVV